MAMGRGPTAIGGAIWQWAWLHCNGRGHLSPQVDSRSPEAPASILQSSLHSNSGVVQAPNEVLFLTNHLQVSLLQT